MFKSDDNMSCSQPRLLLIPPKESRDKGMRCQIRPFGDWRVPRGTITDGGFTVEYVPCGRCLACRIERRQELTMLQMCEASLHDENWFLTLTYDDALCDFDPMEQGLCKEHLQKFNESMRLACKYRGINYRYFSCGEYGDKLGRPHYHLSIFGVPSSFFDLEDDDSLVAARMRDYSLDGHMRFYRNAALDENGNYYWQSDVIAKRWRYGNHKIYRANHDTFQYVAGYVEKKLYGKSRRKFEADGRLASYHCQSRPSIGYPWWLKYRNDLSVIDGDRLVKDELVVSGIRWKIPRIMNRWLRYYFPLVDYEALRDRRLKDAPSYPEWSELRRKGAYNAYRARCKDNNNTHKEIS